MLVVVRLDHVLSSTGSCHVKRESNVVGRETVAKKQQWSGGNFVGEGGIVGRLSDDFVMRRQTKREAGGGIYTPRNLTKYHAK